MTEPIDAAIAADRENQIVLGRMLSNFGMRRIGQAVRVMRQGDKDAMISLLTDLPSADVEAGLAVLQQVHSTLVAVDVMHKARRGGELELEMRKLIFPSGVGESDEKTA